MYNDLLHSYTRSHGKLYPPFLFPALGKKYTLNHESFAISKFNRNRSGTRKNNQACGERWHLSSSAALWWCCQLLIITATALPSNLRLTCLGFYTSLIKCHWNQYLKKMLQNKCTLQMKPWVKKRKEIKIQRIILVVCWHRLSKLNFTGKNRWASNKFTSFTINEPLIKVPTLSSIAVMILLKSSPHLDAVGNGG